MPPSQSSSPAGPVLNLRNTGPFLKAVWLCEGNRERNGVARKGRFQSPVIAAVSAASAEPLGSGFAALSNLESTEI